MNIKNKFKAVKRQIEIGKLSQEIERYESALEVAKMAGTSARTKGLELELTKKKNLLRGLLDKD